MEDQQQTFRIDLTDPNVIPDDQLTPEELAQLLEELAKRQELESSTPDDITRAARSGEVMPMAPSHGGPAILGDSKIKEEMLKRAIGPAASSHEDAAMPPVNMQAAHAPAQPPMLSAAPAPPELQAPTAQPSATDSYVAGLGLDKPGAAAALAPRPQPSIAPTQSTGDQIYQMLLGREQLRRPDPIAQAEARMRDTHIAPPQEMRLAPPNEAQRMDDYQQQLAQGRAAAGKSTSIGPQFELPDQSLGRLAANVGLGVPLKGERMTAGALGNMAMSTVPLLSEEGMLAKAPAAIRTLATRYPKVASALERFGASIELPGANRSVANAIDRAAQEVHAATLRNGGITMDLRTGKLEIPTVDKGYMVGKYSNQSGKTKIIPEVDFTPAHVQRYIEQHAEEFVKNPDAKIGAWKSVNKKTGVPSVFLDVAQKFEDVPRLNPKTGKMKPPKQGQALRKAIQNAAYQRQPKGTVRDPITGKWPQAQEAIFDIHAGDERPVGNFAEFVGSQRFRDRMTEMRKVGMDVMNGKDWWDIYGSDLERVYGKERVRPLAALLATTSSGSPPVENLRAASEYMRRLIKGEELIQPDFRIPQSAVGYIGKRKAGKQYSDIASSMSGIGKKMPKEAGGRTPNLLKAQEGWRALMSGDPVKADSFFTDLNDDKVNDMFAALTGELVGVFDRHWAKLAEVPEEGILAETGANVLKGSKVSGKVGSYALIENAVRTAAKEAGVPLPQYSAQVWEGIRHTIRSGKPLFGTKYKAEAIPEIVGGFPGIFQKVVEQKAKLWGMTVPEFERRLRNGSAELLGAVLATPIGMSAWRQWQQGDQQTGQADLKQ